jgi:polyphosphate glucokinase
MGVLGIDVGGSGVKGAVVDTDTGKLLSERIRIATPKPSTPKKIAGVVKKLVDQLDYSGPAGCSFPTVVVGGQALTAAISTNPGEVLVSLSCSRSRPA